MSHGRLSRSERLLLFDVLRVRAQELESVAKRFVDGGGVTLDEVNELRDALGEELLATGFVPSTDEPNPRGLLLETLIDAIARHSGHFD